MNFKIRYKSKLFILGLIMLFLSSCASYQNKTQNYIHTNSLINESSPYLIQHAHNPVNWVAWNDETLKQAKEQNKILIISIGYSACHWCHVMEEETFMDENVAKIMNDNFICVKVDREERPDVDQVYMSACKLLNGSGGWPLNVFALPNGKPFYAGTYYKKSDWTKIIEYFSTADRNNITSNADELTVAINSHLQNLNPPENKNLPTRKSTQEDFKNWKINLLNLENSSENKTLFPMPTMWEYALQYGDLFEDSSAIEMVSNRLLSMANGGIYDQIDGGFSRYSTDQYWHVPHFEKMLNDNAQLVSLYAHAWQKTKKPIFKKTVIQTLDFVQKNLTSADGRFYSSIDADSEGTEGKYYTWTKEEINIALKVDAPLFCAAFDVNNPGNWEKGLNVLRRTKSTFDLSSEFNLSFEEIESKLATSLKTLSEIRSSRIRPAIDNKTITSWNAMMLHGFAQSYRVFGHEDHKTIAIKNAEFLLKKLRKKDGGLYRIYNNGKPSIHGFLDDYVFLATALIELYQATFDEKWLNEAKRLTDYAHEHFYDEQTGMYFYSSDDSPTLIVRSMETLDNVVPSSNSEMAKNLLKLGHYFENEEYLSRVEKLHTYMLENLQIGIYSYSNWKSLQLTLIHEPFEIAIMGENARAKRHELEQGYLNNALIMGSNTPSNLPLLEGKFIDGKTMIYICRERTCSKPIQSTSEALKLMKSNFPN